LAKERRKTGWPQKPPETGGEGVFCSLEKKEGEVQKEATYTKKRKQWAGGEKRRKGGKKVPPGIAEEKVRERLPFLKGENKGEEGEKKKRDVRRKGEGVVVRGKKRKSWRRKKC